MDDLPWHNLPLITIGFSLAEFRRYLVLYWFSVNWKFAFGALAWFRDKDDHS